MASKSVIFLFCFFLAEDTVVMGQKKSTSTQGICASAGIPGIPGVPGNPGRDGMSGSRGEKGEPGVRGNDYADLVKSNWKQCVWKRQDSKNTGLIQDCTFNKKYDNTSLRVLYAGNLRTYGSGVCSRWYFTFDGAECTKPATIEGVFYVGSTSTNTHIPNHIEGYCNQVPKGHVRVGLWIGTCASYSASDGYTGWNSMSRIMIEEVPPPQL